MKELMNSEEYKTYEKMCHKFYMKCKKIVRIIVDDKIPVEEFLHFVINGENIMGMCDNINNYILFPKRLMYIDDEKELIETITELKKKYPQEILR